VTTMAELARVVGVSPMTVSRVLSGTEGKVAEETRERVLAEARRHKLEVNHIARAHYSKRAWAVGLATPFEGLLGSEYFARVVQGVREEFDEGRWGLSLFDTRAKSVACGHLLDRYFRQRRIDGFLIIAPTSEDRFVRSLSELEVPLALVGEWASDESVRCVDADPEPGMCVALESLYGLGHRRVGYLRGPANIGAAERRWQVFCRFCREKAIARCEELVVVSDFTRSGGRRAFEEIWGREPKPTAVLAANDLMALGFCDAARDAGVSIPGELSVVGFDDIQDAAEGCPPLSTVRHPMEGIGRKAGELLKSALGAPVREPVTRVLLSTEFVPRASHGKVGTA
jgi:LacI family transcriptional regulator